MLTALFDRLVGRIKGHRRVASIADAARVGDTFEEDGDTYICIDVSTEREGNHERLVVDVEELESMSARERALWLFAVGSTVIPPAALAAWWFLK